MPSQADIIRDSINELSRVQDWMELAKKIMILKLTNQCIKGILN